MDALPWLQSSVFWLCAVACLAHSLIVNHELLLTDSTLSSCSDGSDMPAYFCLLRQHADACSTLHPTCKVHTFGPTV